MRCKKRCARRSVQTAERESRSRVVEPVRNWLIIFIASAAATRAAAAQPAPAQPTPAALELFQRDWVLMNWALKYFDADGDIALSLSESAAAAEAFRKIADIDQDGRVTPAEYRAAREAILSRY